MFHVKKFCTWFCVLFILCFGLGFLLVIGELYFPNVHEQIDLSLAIGWMYVVHAIFEGHHYVDWWLVFLKLAYGMFDIAISGNIN
jgi:hypothetical protein